MTTMAPSRPSIPPHDHTPRPYAGPSRQEVLAMRRQYCHPSTFLYYREPLMVVETPAAIVVKLEDVCSAEAGILCHMVPEPLLRRCLRPYEDVLRRDCREAVFTFAR